MKRKKRVKKYVRVNQVNKALIILIFFAALYVGFRLINSYIYNAKQGNFSMDSAVQCLQEGKRYTLSEAINDPRVCDVEISTEEELNKIAQFSKQLGNVQSIYLRKTANTYVPKEIGSLQNLTSLNFHHTFNTSLPREIDKLKKLRVISMNKADISEIPGEIGELAKLENLTIINNAGRVILPPEMGNLESLKVLALSGCPELELPEEISNLQSLEELYLDDCNLNTIPEQILTLTNLKILNISYNYLTAAEVAKARQLLPGTTVIFQN